MEEKTEELRELFLDVTDEETLTESQEDSRGSLTGESEPVDERLEAVIAQLDEKFGVQTSLSDDQECQLVRLFYAGESDAAIASSLDIPVADVFDARMALLLVREADIPEPELGREHQRELLAEGTVETVAEETGLETAVVERAKEALTADERSGRVSHRFRIEFEEILTDADLTVRFTVGAHEDGLEDATDGAEVDVEF